MFQYRVKVLRVVDGDTVDCEIDLGFGLFTKERIRLFGVNTPETRTRDLEEKKAGYKAKARTTEFLEAEEILLISKEFNRGKFGRVLGDFLVDGCLLTETLLEEDLAEEYIP